jgi:hypothetical protein
MLDLHYLTVTVRSLHIQDAIEYQDCSIASYLIWLTQAGLSYVGGER